MKILIYTYRTFPLIKDLQKLSYTVIVLGKLKKDITILEDIIKRERPTHIIGIAKGNKQSLFETQTVNSFNGKKV